jgi:universal stress protein A
MSKSVENRDRAMSGKTMLVATDYSSASDHALQHASSLASCMDAKLLIVHVSELEPYPVGELVDEKPRPDPKELERLNAFVPKDLNVCYEHQLLYGSPGSSEITKPAEVLVRFARERHVDMIVLGSHAKTGLRHLFMGSVAESVIRQADCPVLTIRQPENETQRAME